MLIDTYFRRSVLIKLMKTLSQSLALCCRCSSRPVRSGEA